MHARVMLSTLALLVVVAASLLVSCGTERTIAPGPVAYETPSYVAPTSPERVLENLVTAHIHRDIAGYAACFTEDFVFVPSPRDHLRFDQLSREEDLASTARMFAEVSGIEMSLVAGDVRPSSRVDLPADDGYLETVAIAFLQLELPAGGEEIRTLTVPHEPAYFVFEPSLQGGETIYRIVRQEDRR